MSTFVYALLDVLLVHAVAAHLVLYYLGQLLAVVRLLVSAVREIFAFVLYERLAVLKQAEKVFLIKVDIPLIGDKLIAGGVFCSAGAITFYANTPPRISRYKNSVLQKRCPFCRGL